MVQCLYQSNIYIKRKLGLWRAQKCTLLLGAKEVIYLCGTVKTTPTHVQRYRAKNGNLEKSGPTFRHGPVFEPKKCLYQKEAWTMETMESPKMYSSSRCKILTYLCGTVNYPVSCKAVRAENGNLGKSGPTFLHGAVFTPKQCLY